MPGIMIQGTASSVGKSLITAAFCRIFANDGYRVSPFKSQNMSLNSYVTAEGLEMGRAQVLQAQAARLEPTVKMNPILLKPSTDRKSQVIVHGKSIGTMDAQTYFSTKSSLKEMVLSTYHEIEQTCDLVVIEGAGSPAEINLKQDDIVNMGMAAMADAPVILVADIDKGGVFASVYGTVMLLEPEERARIRGILINKFRGAREILQPGLSQLEELTGIPVIGVIPMLSLHLDEEDGATHFEGFSPGRSDQLRISVIKLPRMSNFTDFDAFQMDSDVMLQYIDAPEQMWGSDLVILPGSKNTIEDLRELKRRGFDHAIQEFPGIVFGICGGYQMMGKQIVDQDGWEVEPGTIEDGLGLFAAQTVFHGEKITRLVTGTALGWPVYGYEIHAGRTMGTLAPFVTLCPEADASNSIPDGESKDGRHYGTYLHGIFDSGEFRGHILNILRSKRDLPLRASLDRRKRREEDLEQLAEQVRAHMDMEALYQITGLHHD